MSKGRILYICGSINQTTQMQQIARELAEYEAYFTPYYGDHYVNLLRRLRLIEFSIGGYKLRQRCVDHLRAAGERLDIDGQSGGYDLVLTCTDLVVPRNVREGGQPVVLVQEGIMDPVTPVVKAIARWPNVVPRWLAGTAGTGLSRAYDRFCVASRGYLEHFVHNGAPREKLVVTGIPNFDDCRRYYDNDFPHRGYALCCTSDARETHKLDNRREFVERAVRIAGERQLIFKLHPNEDAERSTRELEEWAPGALVYASGSAAEMVANCDVLITQYSTLSFVGVALGKEVHSYFSNDELHRLLPEQNGRAAANIAGVCRTLLGQRPVAAVASSPNPARRTAREAA